MNHDKNKEQPNTEALFEAAFFKASKVDKAMLLQQENRSVQHNMESKLEKYKQYSDIFPHINHIQMRQDEIIVTLPDNVQAKYILKSISYLTDEWVTLRTTFIKQGSSEKYIVIDMEQVDEEQIANLCAELNECIDHFVARAARD